MQTQNNNMVYLSKEDIKFLVNNPRLAGMAVDPSDPTPYMQTMDAMADSMIETYKQIGSLLLQPIVIDDNGSVRAGYTRAMTFVHKYDYLVEALGIDDLTIMAVPFSGLTSAEAMMENLMRKDQHYMATAFALKEAIEANSKVKDLAHQVGMSTERILRLKCIADNMLPELVNLCYHCIEEKAAVIISSLDVRIQHNILSYISNHVTGRPEYRVKDENDVNNIIRWTTKRLPEWVPAESFTDTDGNEHPAVHDEEWFIPGDMFGNYCVSMEKAEERSRLYWTAMLEEMGISNAKLSDDINEYNYRTVNAGSHPLEIAVWCRGDKYSSAPYCYVEFMVKESDYETLDLEQKVKHKEISSQKRTSARFLNIQEKAKSELKQEMLTKLWNKENKNLSALLYDAAKVIYCKLSKAEMIKAEELLKVDNLNITDIEKSDEPQTIIDAMLFAMAFCSGYAAAKLLFKDNRIKFDKAWTDKQNELAHLREEMEAKSEDKVKELKDRVDDVQTFLSSLPTIAVLIGSEMVPLADAINNGHHEILDERVLKYVAKGLKIPYKGSAALMQMRIANTITKLEENLGIAVTTFSTDMVERLDLVINGQLNYELMLIENSGHMKEETIHHAFKGVVDKYMILIDASEEDRISTVIALKSSQRNKILAESANNAGLGIEEWREVIRQVMYVEILDRLTEYFNIGFKIITVPVKGKMRILGK